MNKQLKDYFTFTRRELSGILVLLILIVAFAILPKFYGRLVKSEPMDVSGFEKQIEAFEFAQIQKKQTADKKAKKEPQYFSFDPNTVTKNELLRLGFSDKQAHIFLNYRNSGAVFYQKQDILKVYGISKKWYKKMLPYIKIDTTALRLKIKNIAMLDTTAIKIVREQDTLQKTPRIAMRIHLNTADSIDLIKLPGIGPAFSRRIISYRKFLGGYVQKEQLNEIYGMSEKTYRKIIPNIDIDTSLIVKIDLNKADFKTLNKHPYLDYKQTKVILKFRDLMGAFNSPSQLLENHLIDSLTYRKIKPYLIIN